MKKIGVTTYIDTCGKKNRNMISTSSVKAIDSVDAIPIVIPLSVNHNKLEGYIDTLDGIIFTGGVDINPFLYGHEPMDHTKHVSDIRDSVEMHLLRLAIKKGIPVMGICRGFQLINIYYGGTLYQDINSEYNTDIDHQGKKAGANGLSHDVTLVEDSKVFKVYKQKKLGVNSMHHQAIHLLGKGLRVTASADDGIIEAVEHMVDNVMGVQWHPENLIGNMDDHSVIFKHFVDSIA
jgi:putative glutamine amidotransferase